jgi:hypothetical protein
MHGRTRIRRCTALLTLAALVVVAAGHGLAADKKDKGAKDTTPPAPSGKKMDSAALARFIDTAIDGRLREEKVPASPRCDDAEFLRRVYLDVTGHIPPADKVATFLDSKDPDKRGKLIDELLASPEYGKHLADIWQALLLPKNSDNRRLDTQPMVSWLEESFNANKPWDRMVRELLTASGEQNKNGAVTYFLANGTVDKMTDNVTKVFLGVQLQCAQCHNHPFTAWKQTEYWGMAAFFLKVQATPPQMAAQQGTSPAVTEVENPRRGRNPLPDSAKRLPPKFLGAEEPRVDAKGPVRPVLANWITTARNPYFGKAMVNRVWSQYFGRGLVNPVDDMHDGNPASHPQLLAELADQLAQNDFDVKYLVRAVCNSDAYQRTSKPAGANLDAGAELFSRMAVKAMTPEQLFDSLSEVLGGMGQAPAARGPAGRGPANPRAAFVAFFGVEDGSDPTEYQAGIPQALRLMNAPRLNNAAVLDRLTRAGNTPAQNIEQVYLAALSRRPSSTEVDRLTAHIQKHEKEPRKAYSDVLWALLNSSEFTLNH